MTLLCCFQLTDATPLWLFFSIVIAHLKMSLIYISKCHLRLEYMLKCLFQGLPPMWPHPWEYFIACRLHHLARAALSSGNILLLSLLHVTFKQLPVSKEDAQFRTRWMRRGRRPSRAFAHYVNDWQHVRARSMLGGCLIQTRHCLTNTPSNIRSLQEKRQAFSLPQWWVVIVTGPRVKGKGLRGIGKYILVQS